MVYHVLFHLQVWSLSFCKVSIIPIIQASEMRTRLWNLPKVCNQAGKMRGQNSAPEIHGDFHTNSQSLMKKLKSTLFINILRIHDSMWYFPVYQIDSQLLKEFTFNKFPNMFSILRLHSPQSDSLNAFTISSRPPTTDFQYHFTAGQTYGTPAFLSLAMNSMHRVPSHFHFSNNWSSIT